MNTNASMPTLNLLPRSRQARQARARAASHWLTAGVLVAVGSFIPAGALALGHGDDLTPIQTRIDRAQSTLARLRSEQPALQAELAALRARSIILDDIGDKIDWLPVLGAIASAAHDARFEQIELRLDASGEQIDLRLIGMVETQSDARALVLRLEDLGIIGDIKLSTTRVTLRQDVYRFDIAGVIAQEGVE